MTHIFAVNPGATSTKVAAYEDTTELWRETIHYTDEEFAGSTTVFDQFERRAADIRTVLLDHDLDYRFDACAGRGGLIGPVEPGAYVVDDAFVEILRDHPLLDHASNLGGALAREVAREFGVPGCPAYVYDLVSTDSMMDIARITGLADVRRTSIGHHLNMHAVAIDLAGKLGKTYGTSRIVVVHMGGGSTASAHADGHVVDFISDDELMFSAERSGGVPLKALLPVLQGMDPSRWSAYLRKNAGLMSHCGTTDMRVIEERIDAGDEQARLVIEALGLQIAKAMASLAASLEGRVDGLILTGGMAHSELLCREVEKRASWIAPFHVYPGEAELPALAGGALRVLRGEEPIHRVEDHHA